MKRKGFNNAGFIFSVLLFFGILSLVITYTPISGDNIDGLNTSIQKPDANATSADKAVTQFSNLSSVILGVSSSNPAITVLLLGIIGTFIYVLVDVIWIG